MSNRHRFEAAAAAAAASLVVSRNNTSWFWQERAEVEAPLQNFFSHIFFLPSSHMRRFRMSKTKKERRQIAFIPK